LKKERGFGFVHREITGTDLFVHIRSLNDNLRELEIGQKIQFRIQTTEKVINFFSLIKSYFNPILQGEEACDVYLIKNDEKLNQ
jgi:cold shock CspA family protein